MDAGARRPRCALSLRHVHPRRGRLRLRLTTSVHAREPVAIFAGEVLPLYARDLDDATVHSLLDELAGEIGAVLEQEEVHIAYRDQTWTLKRVDRRGGRTRQAAPAAVVTFARRPVGPYLGRVTGFGAGRRWLRSRCTRRCGAPIARGPARCSRRRASTYTEIDMMDEPGRRGEMIRRANGRTNGAADLYRRRAYRRQRRPGGARPCRQTRSQAGSRRVTETRRRRSRQPASSTPRGPIPSPICTGRRPRAAGARRRRRIHHDARGEQPDRERPAAARQGQARGRRAVSRRHARAGAGDSARGCCSARW